MAYGKALQEVIRFQKHGTGVLGHILDIGSDELPERKRGAKRRVDVLAEDDGYWECACVCPCCNYSVYAGVLFTPGYIWLLCKASRTGGGLYGFDEGALG